nr:MAG TPA_asm: hypothetical protein [Caudoviricetes sp.]
MSVSYRCLVVENTVRRYILIPTQNNRLYKIAYSLFF